MTSRRTKLPDDVDGANKADTKHLLGRFLPILHAKSMAFIKENEAEASELVGNCTPHYIHQQKGSTRQSR